MKCEVVQEKLSCYLDGVIDEATMEMIEDHLDGCSECRAELAALQTLMVSMGTAFEVEPPVGLKNAIHDAIDREPVVSLECETVLALLSELVDGELGSNDRVMATGHIDSCDSCAREYVMMQRTISAVGSVCAVDPPLTLRSRIAAAISREKRSASPLHGLIEKTRRVLHPVGFRWTAGAAAATAILMMTVASPLRHSDVVTVAQDPEARVDVGSAPSTPSDSTNAQTAEMVVEVVRAEPTQKAASLRQRHTEPPKLAETGNEHVKTAHASTDRTNGNRSQTPVVEARTDVANSLTPVVANSDAASDVKVVEAARAPETAVVTAANPENSKKETAGSSETRPVEVKVAAQEPIAPPQDDQAMIRSLKQQMRMKKKGEGVSVDLLDVRF